MAHLVRPWTYRYLDKDGKRVPKGTPGASKIKEKSTKWYGAKIPGYPKGKRVPLSSNKRVALDMLNKLITKGERREKGLDDPMDDERLRPLAEHLDAFDRYLAAKGGTADHVAKTVNRCRALLDAIKAAKLDDVKPSAVLQALADLRQNADRPRVELPEGKEQLTRKELASLLGINVASVARALARDGLTGTGNGKKRRYPRAVAVALQDRLCCGRGVSTSNHYLTAVKSFTRWLVKDHRAPNDPLACLSRQNGEADIRVERRALDAREFAALLDAARVGQPFRDLSGPDRAVLYVLAARTGLRASELASLSPDSFDFGAPSVTVEAAYSKHRRQDVQPLPADVADLLRRYVEGKPAHARLWPSSWPRRAAEMLRHDLVAAGIPFVDEDGRVYDFHSLRHQFISDLVEAGVHPKDAQQLARHSTITLTMDRYAHVRPTKLHAALDQLPSLTTPPATPQAGQRA
jgi:integrase